ncbi:hypothetical protein [Cyanobium gracile]|uniref:Uncharacterized protein n=1 Tax=Cyanobium gracile UHCC 0281 TaxID=3110309 RepID=A0ABU5SZG9_9CYAN|nr:hypothetical protein [Cyanobium gracile]MEA5443881.1 hypothetical protein [Cyanobium gracile UHCC 0281]
MSDRPQGDWWRFVPAKQRRRRRFKAWRLRWGERLRHRGLAIALAFLAYGLIVLWLLLTMPPVVALLALTPMVLLPLLGYLTYWLLWKEFHE